MSQATLSATILFEEDVHEALQRKAVATQRPFSELVNEAVKLSLAEDALDLEALAQRRDEAVEPFESVVADLRSRGRL